MSKHFRVERVPGGALPVIRVYANHTDALPFDKNWINRFGSFLENTKTTLADLDKIHRFEIRPDDVWLISYPKSGTTWMAEMLWLLMSNFDYKKAYAVDQEDRCRYLEFSTLVPFETSSLDEIASWTSPRCIRSHLPMHMLPKGLWTVKPKIIYVARDPCDVLVSLMHHLNVLMPEFTFDDSQKQFLYDETPFNPFWDHVLEFWSIRNEDYVLFTTFEKMKSNLRAVVEDVAKHLQKNISEEEMEKLLKHLSFGKMKNNPKCQHIKESRIIQPNLENIAQPIAFIRKGEVGSHKTELSDKLGPVTQTYKHL